MTEMTTVAATMGETIKAFRSAAVSAENKATPMARSILAALMVGATSVDGVTAAVIASFGNPKSSKTGKPVSNLSGLREFVGGDATRKTVESIFKIFENCRGQDTLKAMATAFILEADGAAKSLRALDVAVKDALRADAAKEMGTEGENAENVNGETAPAASNVVSTLGDRLNAMALEISTLSDDEFRAVTAEIAAIRKAMADRMDLFTMSALKQVA